MTYKEIFKELYMTNGGSCQQKVNSLVVNLNLKKIVSTE